MDAWLLVPGQAGPQEGRVGAQRMGLARAWVPHLGGAEPASLFFEIPHSTARPALGQCSLDASPAVQPRKAFPTQPGPPVPAPTASFGIGQILAVTHVDLGQTTKRSKSRFLL